MSAKKAKKKAVDKKTATKKAKAKLMLLPNIAAALGVTERTVQLWVKRGCPCRRVKSKTGRRPKTWMSLEAVKNWMSVNEIEERVAGEEPPAPPPEPDPNGKDPDRMKSGIVGAIARLRTMERVAYAAFLQSYNSKEPAARLRAKERIYINANQALCRTEKEVPAILERRGEIIPLETVIAEQAKIDLAVKNQFLTLPRKITGQLSAMIDATIAEKQKRICGKCKKKESLDLVDPGEIEELLQTEIDDCLRHIASGAVLSDEAPTEL